MRKPTMQMKSLGINDDERLEGEAEHMGKRAATPAFSVLQNASLAHVSSATTAALTPSHSPFPLAQMTSSWSGSVGITHANLSTLAGGILQGASTPFIIQRMKLGSGGKKGKEEERKDSVMNVVNQDIMEGTVRTRKQGIPLKTPQ